MNWIAILKILGDMLVPLAEAYAKIRDLARQSGEVTEEQLAEADARWMKVYTDPLAGWTPPPPPHPPGPKYMEKFDPPVPSDEWLKDHGYVSGDKIAAKTPESSWLVVRKNSPTLGMSILRTIA